MRGIGIEFFTPASVSCRGC